MSKIEIMRSKLSNIDNTLHKFSEVYKEETRKTFSILSDYQGQSYVVTNNTENTISIIKNEQEISIEHDSAKLFQVLNAKRVIFIPVDGKKGLLGFGTSYCDVIIFDEHNFCFIEFKLNATSEKKITKNRVDAIGQIINTIAFFDNKLNKNYAGLDVEAYVCMPPKFPKNDATWKNLSVKFLEDYGIDIFEANQKICK